METTRYGHQGDIEILHLNAPPPDLDGYIEVTDGEFVVAFGEATGHRHRVVGDRVRFFRPPDGLNSFALVEQDGALLLHEEHRTHGLPIGWTQFRRQQEQSLEAAGWRPVID